MTAAGASETWGRKNWGMWRNWRRAKRPGIGRRWRGGCDRGASGGERTRAWDGDDAIARPAEMEKRGLWLEIS